MPNTPRTHIAHMRSLPVPAPPTGPGTRYRGPRNPPTTTRMSRTQTQELARRTLLERAKCASPTLSGTLLAT
eukprot:CAMPEP_0206163436 /NCGR_PEP_ID=MMETSP1474-20131121/11412_1 /ASSEMBLY_ACC=CAM_ASM_001110 /TAXON_ID=97495 /ORGANISM="Imantonia sp., Strain RCC918" /LENGTH=71 /DNA_ID=CAMNT_0053565937 /DNA_START=108 /DNA_END=319 /DNA_ORIENTATION=+